MGRTSEGLVYCTIGCYNTVERWMPYKYNRDVYRYGPEELIEHIYIIPDEVCGNKLGFSERYIDLVKKEDDTLCFIDGTMDERCRYEKGYDRFKLWNVDFCSLVRMKDGNFYVRVVLKKICDCGCGCCYGDPEIHLTPV